VERSAGYSLSRMEIVSELSAGFYLQPSRTSQFGFSVRQTYVEA